VAANPPQKDSANVIERKCRVVLDVAIRINEITPENVAHYFTPSETGTGLSWEWAERQNRLLHALLEDEASLDEFLRLITRDELEVITNNVYAKPQSDDELFERIYSKMDEEDALYFETAQNDGLLGENLELIYKAFVIGWKEAAINGVRVIRAGEDEAKATDKAGGN
jgi:hypothetical protein